MLRRTHWLERIATLDPQTDYEAIYRITVTHEFPWDMNQALSLALFRTYAVPSIGRLLHETGEFERDTQRRYDDTVLLLDEVSIEGMHSESGRRAIRRINQMHGSYDIADGDMRYVLSTFVVVPKQWLDDYGWRPMTPAEVTASTRYYAELGRLMGIPDVPRNYAEFEDLMDAYEADHFAHDAGARQVADATLALVRSFYPRIAAVPVDVFSRSLMDAPLLEAFGYRRPPAAAVAAVRATLRARARAERMLPARREPLRSVDFPRIRSYPDGYDIEALGTFPRGCPAGVNGRRATPAPR